MCRSSTGSARSRGPVDVDAARAKFLKKRGVLQVTLPDVCV